MKPLRYVSILSAIVSLFVVGACRRSQKPEPAVATPTVVFSTQKVPLGSPVDITYTFTVAPDAPPLTETYRVFVGFVDPDGQLMWTDDHNPPVPTTQWKANQIVTYTRTMFVPVYPYVGEARVNMGLYSTQTQKRVSLNGKDAGMRSYEVARLQLQPQTDSVFVSFKSGWHPAEVAEHNSLVSWQWTKKNAVLEFKNPKKDSTLYLETDNPGNVFSEPQKVQLVVGGKVIQEFTVQPKEQPVLRKIPITAAQLGGDDLVDLEVNIDKTFVPALLNVSSGRDQRELGVRVFHAYLQPN